MAQLAANIEDTTGAVRIDGFVDSTAIAPAADPTFTGTVTLPTVVVASLPTADPHVAGHLWANSGVVTVSAG